MSGKISDKISVCAILYSSVETSRRPSIDNWCFAHLRIWITEYQDSTLTLVGGGGNRAFPDAGSWAGTWSCFWDLGRAQNLSHFLLDLNKAKIGFLRIQTSLVITGPVQANPVKTGPNSGRPGPGHEKQSRGSNRVGEGIRIWVTYGIKNGFLNSGKQFQFNNFD